MTWKQTQDQLNSGKPSGHPFPCGLSFRAGSRDAAPHEQNTAVGCSPSKLEVDIMMSARHGQDLQHILNTSR